MSKRPLIVFLTPQAANTRDYYQSRDEGPTARHWFEEVFDEAGLDHEIIAPGGWPWNPLAGRHGAFQGLDPLRGLKVLLSRRRAAVVVAYTESPALIALQLRRAFCFPVPIILCEVSWSPGWAYREWLARRTIPHADRVIVYSSNQIDLLQQTYTGMKRPEFFPISLDVEFFTPQPRQPGPPSVLTVGLDQGRDFDILLEATRGMDVHVRIKGGRKPVIFDRAAHPNVSLIETHLAPPAFRALYADATIVAVTTFSTPNACGVTSLLEAMAMAKPIIVSANPALRDYIPPDDACIVVPIGDRAALGAAIAALLANPSEAAAMGERARRHLLATNHPRLWYERLAALSWELAIAAGTAARPA